VNTSLKASVIVPCFNGQQWIEKTLLSALAQTYKNIEVIFVDNESTDESLQIATRLKENNPNLIVAEAENIYPRCWDEAREKGFSIATGDYLFTLAADDFYEESYIGNCMRYLSHDPDRIKALQSPIRNFSEYFPVPSDFTGHFYKSLEDFKQLSLTGCPVNSPTVIYSRELYTKGLIKTDPGKYSGAADYDLYCKLADAGVFIYPVNTWLGYNYRWHPGQATWEMHQDPVNYDQLIQAYWSEKWQI